MRIYLNDNWMFAEDFQEAYLERIPKEEFKKIRVPHTVKEIPLNYVNNEVYQMISTYYTELDLREYIENECFLVFEGNAHSSEVYVNGTLSAVHKTGYTGFKVPIEHWQKTEKTRILVKLDSRETLNIPPFGNVIDYLTYGGIYRDTYLEIKKKSFIEDVFVKADQHRTLKLEVKYFNKKEGQKLKVQVENVQEELEAVENVTFQNVEAKLWSVDHPNLYPLTLSLIENGEVLDEYKTMIGFRSISIDENGIFINGEKLKLRGLNRHQSYAYVGYAMPERVERRDARILKYELGLNAVRTSHYPNSHDFLEECDRIGLLVFTEIPGWQYIGDQEWQDIAVLNVKDMILQYRNHPSIFMWGVRINESEDHHALYTRTNEAARALDDTRLIGGVRYIENSELLEDVLTFNDFIHNGTNEGVRKKSQVTKDIAKPLLVTEYNGHMYPTKMTDDEEHRTNHLRRHAKVLDAVAESDEHAGSFGWCMADYNTHRDFGSGDQICYHGVLDIFRNKKPAAFLYASQEDREPILALNSSLDIGDHPAGLLRDIVIMTNLERVKFYQGEKLFGELLPSEEYKNLPHPPILIETLEGSWGDKSKGYRLEGYQDGKPVKTLLIEKFESLHFMIEADTQELVEEKSYDVASIRIEAVNQVGNHLAYFNEPLLLQVSGDVELIGPRVISLKGGFGGFYVKSKQEGKGLVKIFYEDRIVQELEFIVKKAK